MSDMAEADRIQRDLDKTRDRMDERLSQLSDKLSPGQLVDDLLKQFRGTAGGEFAQGLTANLRSNPLPAALTGIGLAWLMVTSPTAKPSSTDSQSVKPLSSGSGIRQWATPAAFDDHMSDLEKNSVRGENEQEHVYTARLHEVKGKALGINRNDEETHETFASRVRDGIKTARENISSVGSSIADEANRLTGVVGDKASEVGGQVSEKAQAVPQMAGEFYRSVIGNPVLLGAVGLAIGAVLGATIPLSETEESTLGTVANTAKNVVRDAAQTVVDEGSDVARKALDTVRDSASKLGLTDKSVSEIVKDAQSGNLIDNAKRVAQDVLDSARTPCDQDAGTDA